MLRKLVVILPLFAVAPCLRAQTVDEIVQKNLQASGGVEALKAKNSIRMTGTLKVQNKVGEATEIEIVIQKVEWNVDIPDSLFKMPAK